MSVVAKTTSAIVIMARHHVTLTRRHGGQGVCPMGTLPKRLHHRATWACNTCDPSTHWTHVPYASLDIHLSVSVSCAPPMQRIPSVCVQPCNGRVRFSLFGQAPLIHTFGHAERQWVCGLMPLLPRAPGIHTCEFSSVAQLLQLLMSGSPLLLFATELFRIRVVC